MTLTFKVLGFVAAAQICVSQTTGFARTPINVYGSPVRMSPMSAVRMAPVPSNDVHEHPHDHPHTGHPETTGVPLTMMPRPVTVAQPPRRVVQPLPVRPVAQPAPVPRTPIVTSPVLAQSDEEEALLDFEEAYLGMLADDYYADAYGIAYNYNFPADSSVSASTQEDLTDIRTVKFVKSYTTLSENIKNQIARHKASGEVDPETLESLNYQLQSSKMNGFSGFLDLMDKSKGPVFVSAAYGQDRNDAALALRQAEEAYAVGVGDYSDVEDAQTSYNSATYWHMASAYDAIKDNHASTPYLYTMATGTDLNMAEAELVAAAEAYHKNPTYENDLIWELAELNFESAQAGHDASLTGISDKLSSIIGGNFGVYSLAKQYSLAADISAIQEELAEIEFRKKYGYSPRTMVSRSRWP